MDLDFYADVPGFAEAARRENELRSTPFLGLPESIAGYPVQAMTFRHVIWLDLGRSPFLLRLPPEAFCGTPEKNYADAKPGIDADIINFIWLLSPHFQPDCKSSGKWRRRFKPNARDKFNKQYSGLMGEPMPKVVAAILQFIEDSWLDAGSGSGERSYYSLPAGMISTFCKNYRVPLESFRPSPLPIPGQFSVLDLPLKIGFQFTRIAARWNDPESPLENRLSDEAVKSYMRDINKKN